MLFIFVQIIRRKFDFKEQFKVKMELLALYALILFLLIIIGILFIVRRAKIQSAIQRDRAIARAQEENLEESINENIDNGPIREDIAVTLETVNSAFRIEENERNKIDLLDLPPAYEDIFEKNE